MLHFSLIRCVACLLLAVFATPAYAAPKKALKPETIDLTEEEPAAEPEPPVAKDTKSGAKKKDVKKSGPRNSEPKKTVPKKADVKKKEPKKAQPPKPEPVEVEVESEPAAPAPAVETVDEEDTAEAAEEAENAENEAQQSAGIECTPAVSEVETRRPIPFSCSPTRKGIERVEVRYRAPAKKKWTKVHLRKSNQDFVGEIPCTVTAKRGIMKLSIVGFSLQGKELARIGGVELNLVDASNEPPPALPGQQAPMRCYDPGECPAELKGSAACPGTKATAGAKSWGAACARNTECQKGLVCLSGTCEQPPKCDSGSECASGECVNGACVVPDPGETSTTLGPPKFNWIGLHIAADGLFVKDAVGVCGNSTDDAQDYSCFEGGNAYKGEPNRLNAGSVKAGFRFATIRALLSYERWFGRLSAGARLGFAIGGAPKDFMPIHAEARVLYSMRPEPLSKRFRPYAGLFAGLMEVQAASKATVIDCIGSSSVDRQACVAETDTRELTTTNAAVKRFDAYRNASAFGFGPTVGVYTAFANDSALNFNLNVILPNMAFQLSAGYVMGL